MNSPLPALCLLLGTAGCSGGAGPGPRGALDHLAKAVKANRPASAYHQLSRKVRQSVDPETFARRWSELRPELRREARRIRARLAQGRGMSARATYPSGITVELRLNSGRWVITKGVMYATDLSTPEGVIKALAAAIDRRNGPELLRLLTDRARQRVGERLDRRARSLRQALQGKLKVRGGRASLSYGAGKVLEMERDREGGWRIRSLE